jgi:hypothetical protein
VAKGVGTFRRMLMGALASLGMGHAMVPPRIEQELDYQPSVPQPVSNKKPRKYRARKKHTQPRKGWPIIFWGDCPRPVSRKVLKKIASEHPLLRR